jgi:hypothetical protein
MRVRCAGCFLLTDVPDRIGDLVKACETEILCEACGDGKSHAPEAVQLVAQATKRAPRDKPDHPWERS